MQMTHQIEERFEEALDQIKRHIVDCQRPAHETVLDDKDVMLRLRICKRTLASLRADGVIPYSKIGKKILYKLSDIQAVIEANKVPNSQVSLRIPINKSR